MNESKPTGRVRAEESLRESEAKFHILTDLAPVGICLTTPDGSCEYANPCWSEMAGLSLEEALGDGWVQGLHPDDREAIFSSWQDMPASADACWGQEYRFKAQTAEPNRDPRIEP
ncbi:MAG: PAS domain-containing protein [Kiritimatiellia bacterium]